MAKRDRWGKRAYVARSADAWIDVPAPHLRIVDEAQWQAAHRRLAAMKAVYLNGTNGRPFGRPPSGDPSKYLLTNIALCGCCGGPLRVRSRSHGKGRKFYYGCSAYHERGTTVCTNKADVPMEEADDIVIEALLDEVLDASMLSDAVDVALDVLRGTPQEDRLRAIEAELETVDGERQRLVSAIAAGGMLDGLVDALRTREELRRDLEAQRAAIRAERRLEPRDEARLRKELLDLARQWRKTLTAEPINARPILASLLEGRVRITPTETPKQWELQGTGTLTGLFSREIFPSGWRPHRDSNPGFSLERAAS